MSEIVGYLIGQVGEMSGMRVAIPTEGLAIGRDPRHCDLVIDHTLVSRRHALISVTGEGRILLLDCQSTNGTYVNGTRLSGPTWLEANDKIEFGKEGKVVFLFESAATTSVSGVLKEAFGETVAPVEWKVGDTILGIYEVTGLLGQGGFGKVYKVHHKGWNLDLAVKSPLPQLFDDEQAMANFIREAETWVNLDLHPNIVQCYYVRTIGGIPRIFAEYVPGGTLHHWIAQKKLTTLEQILDVAIQFAWGLHAAHEKGLVHQDVKPLNVLMTPDGVAKVSDFGLARSKPVVQEDLDTGEGNLVTMAGNFTIPYCSPEQVEAAKQQAAGVPGEAQVKLNRSTDIWSWAVSVLQMFTGKVVWKHGLDAPRMLRTHRSIFGPGFAVKMPKQLAKLLESCFCPSPEDRPKHMLEIVGALIAIYQAECGKAYPRTEPKSAEHLADGLNNRAVSLLDLGKEQEAVEFWEEALRAEPHHPESTYNLGVIYWRTGKASDECLLTELLEMQKTHPQSWIVHYLIGWVQLARGDVPSARRSFEQAINQGGGAEVDTALSLVPLVVPETSNCMRRFEGKSADTKSVCLTPDGRLALSGSRDCALRLWEVANGRCLHNFEGHTGPVNCVATTSNGRYAISSSEDKTVRLWDLATGRCIRTFEGHTAPVNSVCATADDKWVLSGAGDNEIRLWEAATGRCLRTFLAGGSVGSVSISSDGRTALSAETFKLRIWDVSSGLCLRVLEQVEHKGFLGVISSACLSADGRWILSGSRDGFVRLWDSATGACVRTFQGHWKPVNTVFLSSDHRLAISGGEDNTIRLWEVTTGRCLRTFNADDSVSSVCLSSDTHWAVCSSGPWSSQEWTLQLFDLPTTLACSKTTQTMPVVLSHIMNATQAAAGQSRFAESMKLAQVAAEKEQYGQALEMVRQARSVPGRARDSEALDLWGKLSARCTRVALRSAWCVQTFTGHLGRVSCVRLSPDGRHALTGGMDGIRLWELSTGRCVRAIAEGGVNSISISSDGRWVVSGSLDHKLRLWDIESGRCLRTFEGHTGEVGCVCLSSDGRWAVSASTDNTVRLWETATGRCLRVVQEDANHPICVCLSNNGRYALSGWTGQKIHLWDLTTGRCIRTFSSGERNAFPICLSKDDRFALLGNPGNCFRLREISTGRCVREFVGHGNHVVSVWLGSDDLWALSGGWDRTLRLWEVSTGRCIWTFEGHDNFVTSVCLSSDARWALSGSEDKTVRLWELDWELDAHEPADWDEGARLYLQNFLIQHTPFAGKLPSDREPSEAEIALALTRHGKPAWTERDFNKLLNTLGCTGYGWLRPEGVRRELEKMAAS